MPNQRLLAAQAQREATEMRRNACLIAFTEEEWHLWENGDEEYVIPLIKSKLRTGAEKSMLDMLDISVEDMLNGRVEGTEKQDFVHALFDMWNQRLGYKHFGG